ARLLQASDPQFQRIMRLYHWNDTVDSVGSDVVFTTGTPSDWRLRFFGTTDNTKIFNSSGNINPPGSSGMCTALTTYNEILRWITQSPNPFPTQLRAGRVKYYSAIPSSITGTWPSYGGTDQRFWVEFIDYVLGYRQTAAGAYTDISAMSGYGSDF